MGAAKPRDTLTIDHDGETQALVTKYHELKSVRDGAAADMKDISEKLGLKMAEHKVTGLTWGNKRVVYLTEYIMEKVQGEGAKSFKASHPRLWKRFMTEVPVSKVEVR